MAEGINYYKFEYSRNKFDIFSSPKKPFQKRSAYLSLRELYLFLKQNQLQSRSSIQIREIAKDILLKYENKLGFWGIIWDEIKRLFCVVTDRKRIVDLYRKIIHMPVLEEFPLPQKTAPFRLDLSGLKKEEPALKSSRETSPRRQYEALMASQPSNEEDLEHSKELEIEVHDLFEKVLSMFIAAREHVDKSCPLDYVRSAFPRLAEIKLEQDKLYIKYYQFMQGNEQFLLQDETFANIQITDEGLSNIFLNLARAFLKLDLPESAFESALLATNLKFERERNDMLSNIAQEYLTQEQLAKAHEVTMRISDYETGLEVKSDLLTAISDGYKKINCFEGAQKAAYDIPIKAIRKRWLDQLENKQKEV